MSGDEQVLIVGGGFGGISTALNLGKARFRNVKITLISDKSHFEYHSALYRVVTGRSPLEVCIPIRDIFDVKNVEVLEDTIMGMNIKEKKLEGKSGSKYSFDFLVLALGSETAYFNIPGLKQLSFGFKSISEALALKKHLHELFKTCAVSQTDQEEDVCRAHFVIVGAGASGVELAGELAIYAKKLAKQHKVNPSLVTIDLIEAASRVLPIVPEDVSEKAARRLRSLGINIFLNRMVVKEEIEKVFLKDMEIGTKTVIWTAGAKPNHLYSQIEGLELDNKGRVIVDEFLQAENNPHIFVIGDAAATTYVGMAQTAIRDGAFVAETIARKIQNRPLEPYQPRRPIYVIPVGPGWAAALIGNWRFYGQIGWWLRRLADFKYFLSILTFKKALLAFQNGKALCESCNICAPEKEIAADPLSKSASS